MSAALRLSEGGWVVPGNRWDLLAAEPGRVVDVSVVVTHFENQPDLDLVLAALADQTHPRSNLQVVVADDGSATTPVLGPAGRELGARLVRQDDLGFRAAAARNLGAAHCDGEVLAFLDADTVPQPDYLARISRLPSLLPDALVAGRRRHADLTGWTLDRWRAWQRGTGPGPRELTEPGWLRDGHRWSRDLLDADARSYRYLISATMACRRALFTELGGFDATMVGYGGEDWELAARAWTAGAVLAHVPDAVAWHDGPDWADRPLPEEVRRRSKNAETLALAQRIPEPGARGGGRRFAVPDTLVRLADAAWSPAAALLTAEAALGLADVVVLTQNPAVLAECAADPRVRADPRVDPTDPDRASSDGSPVPWADPAPCSEATFRHRVRATMDVLAPIRSLDPTVLARLHEDGLARLEVSDDRGLLLRLDAHRARARARRWSPALSVPVDELAELLFGSAALSAAQAGVVRIDGEPPLAAIYGGWD